MHRWLAANLAPRGLLGELVSDAAHLARSIARPVLCIDQCIEGVHFESKAPAALVGRKAADRSISDLAASAAEPRALLLALSVDRSRDERWIRAVIRAVQREARRFGAELVGGDLSASRGAAHLSVAAIGDRTVRNPIGRELARAGDVVVATGPLGGSRLGRHLAIEPRVREGAWLAELGVRAMIDVSDGLARDLARLARASKVAIELERVPIHADARRAAKQDGESALMHALHDGEDHELAAALPAKSIARFEKERAEFAPSAAIIGRVRRGGGLVLPLDELGARRASWTGRGGWLHGE